MEEAIFCMVCALFLSWCLYYVGGTGGREMPKLDPPPWPPPGYVFGKPIIHASFQCRKPVPDGLKETEPDIDVDPPQFDIITNIPQDSE